MRDCLFVLECHGVRTWGWLCPKIFSKIPCCVDVSNKIPTCKASYILAIRKSIYLWHVITKLNPWTRRKLAKKFDVFKNGLVTQFLKLYWVIADGRMIGNAWSFCHLYFKDLLSGIQTRILNTEPMLTFIYLFMYGILMANWADTDMFLFIYLW